MTQLSISEARKLGVVPKTKSKYKSCKVVIDGQKFDSQKEGAYYSKLKLLQRAGEVIKIDFQPEFILEEGYKREGKTVRPIVYRADFRVTYKDGRVVVIDVKGYLTKEYRLKKKLLLARYPGIDFMEE